MVADRLRLCTKYLLAHTRVIGMIYEVEGTEDAMTSRL